MDLNRQHNEIDGELTIVTGFLDFGRGNHRQQSRSSGDYLEYFRKWARIQNDVIVYTTKEFAGQIYKIRKAFGREKQTIVNVVDDFKGIEPEILAAMEQIEKKGIYQKWRARDYDVSNLAMYDYVVMLKFWMMQDAAAKNLSANMLVWLDFGWNHGGKKFPIEEEFDFLWRYNFEKDKIHLFAKEDPDQEVGFVKLQLMTDGIMTGLFVCAPQNCALLYEYIKEAMWSLLSLDAMDDDQMLLTMVYRRHPQLFKVRRSDWFLPMKEYGGAHLTVREEMVKTKRQTFKNIKNRGIYKTLRLFYIQYIRKTTEEFYDLERRIHLLFRTFQ